MKQITRVLSFVKRFYLYDFFQGLTRVVFVYACAVRALRSLARAASTLHHQFSVEHGLALGKPISFATEKYIKEIDRLEAIYRTQFGSLAMLTNFKEGLTRRFFEAIAARTREIVQVANRDIDNWLKAIMVPIEAQVREYQGQLKRRLESIKKIHEATDTLESRISELEEQKDIQVAHLNKINSLHKDISSVIEAALDEQFELSVA